MKWLQTTVAAITLLVVAGLYLTNPTAYDYADNQRLTVVCMPLGPTLPPLAGPEDIITITDPGVTAEQEAQIEARKVENGRKCEIERTNRLALLLIVLVLGSTTFLALGASSSSKDQGPRH